MPLAELVTAPLLPHSPSPALRTVGLDDVVAAVAGRLSAAQGEHREAVRAAADLAEARPVLQGLLRELLATADTVRVALGVDWRSPAGREQAARAEALLAEAESAIAEAEEWLALLAAAEREAEDARLAAEQRIREAEQAARAGLLAMAGAA